MNRTKTTSTTRRRSLRHAALALVALVALVAASCTADPLDGPDTPNAAGTNPDDVLTFAVAPRPGFTEVTATRAADTKAATKAVIPGLTRDLPNRSAGLSVQEIAGQARNDRGESTAPATRATQTDDATRWEQGDILWLNVTFYQDKQDPNTFDTLYISALKYDANEWRYLTVAEAEDLNTGNIPNFSRLVRWPRESENWADPGMVIVAYYAGSGKPDADGKLTIIPEGEIPTTPLIIGSSGGELSPDVQPVLLQFGYNCSRVRIPAGCKVELAGTEYFPAIEFSPKGISREYKVIDQIPEQSKDTDVFLVLWSNDATAKLTRNGVSHTFTFPETTNAEGILTRIGVSYTLTFYTSGTETPVADYDLTIADEAGLRAFAQAVNAGDSLPNGKPAAEARVLQTANIHLTQGEWVPIGNSIHNPFRGAYNGDGNEISGLNITTATQPDFYKISYAGLFGRVEGAVLTGINLRGVKINIPAGGGADLLCVGSIAGYIKNSTLSLCSADGTMDASSSSAQAVSAGGISGENFYSTISRCRTDVETKATTTNGTAYAGGIAGRNTQGCFILSCETRDSPVTAKGSVQAWAGGIAGANGIGLIAFCRTGRNVVTAQNGTGENYAGGLVGGNIGFLYSCYSRATATATVGAGDKWAGAIAGYNDKQDDVQHCYATDAADKGTSNLDAIPDIIVYDTDPDAGDIFRVMTGFTGKVESITYGGTLYYPFTTTYTPSATPAYGIIPQRAVWTKDAWKDGGSDPRFPEIDYDYEGK